MGTFQMRRPLAALLTALAAVLALVAPVHPATSTAAPGDPVTAASQVEPAVARIDTELNYQHAIGNGAGIVLDPGGQVLTNFHVVSGADRITATVAGRSYPAELVGYDRRHDIAVLQLLGGGGLPAAAIGDSRLWSEGEPVVALGNAQGSSSPLTREVGTVTGFGRTVNAEDSAHRQQGRDDRSDRVRGTGGGRRLRGPGGERGRAGRRGHHRRIGELPNGSRRQGFRDSDQRCDGDRQSDPVQRAVGLRAHRTTGADRRRRAHRAATWAGRARCGGPARRSRRTGAG